LQKKNTYSKISFLVPTYINMCTLYTYTNAYLPQFCSSGFFGPSKCLVSGPGLIFEYPTCSLCVCVHIHTHTPTCTPAPVQNRENTDKILIVPHVQNNVPRHCGQQQVPCRLAEPTHPCLRALVNKLRLHKCTCIPSEE